MVRDKKENLDLQRWIKRIEYCKQVSEDKNKTRGFERFKQFYRGLYEKSLKLANMEIVKINEVYSYVKTCLANLYIRDPYITTNPTNQEGVRPALIQEQVINGDWKKLKIKRHVKKAIRESKIVGRAWIKIGYQASGQEGYIEKEDLWGIHVAYDHVLYDLEAIDPPHDCRWVCHWYKKPVEYLEEKYNVKIDATCTLDTKSAKVKLEQGDTDYAIIFEIWDKESGYKLVYCDGYKDDWLEQIPPVKEGCIGPYQIDGFPFYMIRWDDESGEEDNFPLSPVEVIEPQIIEKIKLRSMELNHIKRHSRQMGVKAGTMKDTEKSKFTKGIDGAVIEFEDYPKDCMHPIGYAQMQPEIYTIEDRIDIDRDKISGQSQLEQGAPVATKTRTLGELDKITKGSGNRKVEEVDVVEDFCEEIAQGLIGLERQFYDMERYTQVIGKIPEEFLGWLEERGKYDGVSIKYTKEDIQCKYLLDIKIGSSIPLNKQNRMEMILASVKQGEAFGLTPGSHAVISLGKAFFRDIDMPEMEEAYQRDLEEMERAKQRGPSPQDKLKIAKQVQDLGRGKSDKELKDVRIQRNKLDVLNKAVEMTEGKKKEDKK